MKTYEIIYSSAPVNGENTLFRTKKGRTQCRRLPALRRVWGRVVLSTKPSPHKYAEAEARTWDLQVEQPTAAPGPPFYCPESVSHFDVGPPYYKIPTQTKTSSYSSQAGY